MRKTILTGLVLGILNAIPVLAQTTNTADDGTVLKQIIVFGRHSIRSSTYDTNTLNRLAANPYPWFEGVPVGYLTPRGQQAEMLLGSYFHEYLIHEGLLTGDSQTDLAKAYFRANSIERSFLTAEMFGTGLITNATIPVHSYAIANPDENIEQVPDPIFDPVAAKVVTIDSARALAELEALYGTGATVQSAYSGELALISSALYPSGTEPAPMGTQGVIDPTKVPVVFAAYTNVSHAGEAVDLGSLNVTGVAIDPFVMQYADGFAMEDVAWGQLTAAALAQQSRITTLGLNMGMRPPYVCRAQSSNAGAHVLRSMEQVVQGENLRGAFGTSKSRVLVVISSDAYVAGLAGLLDLHWTLPGYEPDFCAPGGALVFELRQVKKNKHYIVRVFYTAQTFEQLRNLTPLTLSEPPATTQLVIPAASKTTTNLDVSYATFKGVLSAAIEPRYVQPRQQEVPPPVLNTNSVPAN